MTRSNNNLFELYKVPASPERMNQSIYKAMQPRPQFPASPFVIFSILVAVLAPFVVLVVKMLWSKLAKEHCGYSYSLCATEGHLGPSHIAQNQGKYYPTYLGEVNVWYDDDVHGAGGILRGGGGVSLGVVAVFAVARLGLPGHAGLGKRDGGFGCRLGGGSSFCDCQSTKVRGMGSVPRSYRSRSQLHPGQRP